MKRLVILIVISLLCVGSLWAQSPETEQKIVRKGTSVTGQMRDGCETIRFVDSVGGIKKLPRLERTGKRLKFNVVTVGTPQDCGSTDEEAVVIVTVKDTGDFFPKIIERGVKYKIDSVKRDAITGDSIHYIKYDSIYTKIDPTLCGCGNDTSFRIAVEKLQYNTRYLLWAYVKTVEGVYYQSDNLIMTKQRNKCGGWKANHSVESFTAPDTIDLVYDHEGHSYGVIQIGKQCWTRENVRCERTRNELIVPAGIIGYDMTGKTKYEASEQVPLRYDFENLFLSERQRGYLYNWPAAVDTFGLVTYLPPGKRQGVCPDGWHLPNTYEWYELIHYVLSGHDNDVDKSKLTREFFIGTLESFHDKTPEWQGDSVVKMTFGCDWPGEPDNSLRPGSFSDHPDDRNMSGFAALPANNLYVDPSHTSEGTLGSKTVDVVANFWLATPAPDNNAEVNKSAYSWHIDYDRRGVSSYLRTRARGFSVRCLRDRLSISVNPNSCVFCVPSVVTYTANVAQEPLEDFYFTWFVNGVEQNSSHTATFVYTHPSDREGLVDTVKCRAVRTNNITPETELLEDSVFMKGFESCHVIKVSPSTLTRCVGDTLRVTAERPGYDLKNDYDLAWKINGKVLSSGDLTDLHITPVSPDTTFRLVFPKLAVDSTYMFTVEITPKEGVDAIDIPKDTLLVAVSSKYPSITVCSNCNNNIFVVKKQEHISTSVKVRDNAIWRDNDGHAVAYKRKQDDTVHIDRVNNPYHIEMLATGGCRDTLRNIVLKDPVRGCTVAGRQNNEEGPADEREIWYVFDHEHNYRYPVVQIGERCWMKENMRAVTSPSLSQRRVVDPSVNDTIVLASGATTSRVAHWYNDNRNKNARYGVLYNWFAAVDTALDDGSMSCPLPVNWRGICPEGWHIPTTQEWTAVEAELNGGESVTNASDTLAGLLSGGCDWTVTANTTHSPGNYRDSIRGNSGFDAMPAGYFDNNSGTQQNQKACFWTATEGLNTDMAGQRTLTYDQATIDRLEKSKNMGLSVRCVRNIPTLAIHHKYNGDCSYQLYSTMDNLPYGLTYEWKINGQVMSGSDSTLNFYFTADTNKYHIVCVATKNESVYKDSMDIELPNWPPILTTCSDPYARPIRVSSQHVSSAIWYNEQGDSVHNAISGYVDLPADNYVVYLTNSNNVCRPDTVTVIEPQNTYCRVTSRNASIETAYDGDNYAIDSVKDGDNNYYHVVQIGNLCWTRENMRVTGGLIQGTDYYDPDTFPLVQRGYLYTKSTADAICPEGWHLPTLQEWNEMLQNVMGNDKTYMLTGGCDWKNDNGNTPGNFNVPDRNLSGLTLIPVGNLKSEGGFERVTTHASLWTATDKDASNSYLVRFAYDANTMESKSVPKNLAYSVRCVRDLPQFVLQCFVVNPNSSVEHRVNGDNPILIDSVSDANGNWYGVVQVNGRCWTRENLRATKDSSSADLIDGTKRPISTDGSGNTVNKYQKLYYDFNPNSYDASKTNDKVDIPEALRGYLYNWSAALTVCPKGWHLPSNDEYTDLINYAENNTNMAMLAGYSEYWKSYDAQKSPGYCRTHSSDYCDSLKFSLVPAGNMNASGKFDYGGRSANLWTSTEKDSDNAKRVCFDYDNNKLNTSQDQLKERGFSVRCIRDL